MKSKDDTLSQIINQYEDKMQRLSKENENTEKKILNITEKNKKLLKEIEDVKAEFDKERRTFENSIREVIQIGSEITIQMRNALELDLSDEILIEEVCTKMKEMIINITKKEDSSVSKWVTELKSFISKSLLSFNETVFRQINLDKNYSIQKLKWQNTLDQIALSHEEELKKSNLFYDIRP